MEQPHTSQNNASNRNLIHHDKADGHQYCNGDHDANLRFLSHSFSFNVRFQVILIQFRVDEPDVKLFGAFAEAEGGQQKEWEGRKHRNYCANGADGKANTA